MKSVKTLSRNLDTILSNYIRKRDNYTCYTCGVKKEKRLMDCGHYIKRQYNLLRWDDRNTHCQCRQCNRFKGGMMDIYAYKLIKEYGAEILDEFNSKKDSKLFTPLELTTMIDHYKKLTKEL